MSYLVFFVVFSGRCFKCRNPCYVGQVQLRVYWHRETAWNVIFFVLLVYIFRVIATTFTVTIVVKLLHIYLWCKYFSKDIFCLLFAIFRRGPVAFHSGPVAFHSGSDAKKTAHCESRISQSDCFILMDKK